MTFTLAHGKRRLKITAEWIGKRPNDSPEIIEALEAELLKRYASATMSVLCNAKRSVQAGKVQQGLLDGTLKRWEGLDEEFFRDRTSMEVGG